MKRVEASHRLTDVIHMYHIPWYAIGCVRHAHCVICWSNTGLSGPWLYQRRYYRNYINGYDKYKNAFMPLYV
jgi:hypothetical protein